MGIPHLTRHLVSFSEPIRLGGHGKSPEDGIKSVTSVVIDGPSLVYHIFSTLLSWMDVHLNPFDAQPTCEEVSVAVMTYLVQLRIANVHVVKIYFDGALPLSKRDTRLSRLEKSRRKLETFCMTNRKGFKISRTGREPLLIDPYKVLQSRSIPERYKNLPGNQFMVSSVFEDLKYRWNWFNIKKTSEIFAKMSLFRDSDYPWADICEIVPGEADIYCGELLKENQGTAVLTNDSDLLVHDLGAQGLVIFLNSVEMEGWNPEHPANAEIKAMGLCPATLSRRLGILGVQYLAYELKLDPHAGIRELIRRSKLVPETAEQSPAYIQFMEEYRPRKDITYCPSFDPSVLQTLDTRVSELVLQYVSEPVLGEDVPQIYFPVLHEDHSRRSAWIEGRNIRCLGYSLLNAFRASQERYPVVIECVRRGCRFCFDEIGLYDDGCIELELRTLLSRLRLVQEVTGQDPSSSIFWRIYALNELYNCSDGTLTWPSREELRRFFAFEYTDERMEWTDIHTLARVQAVLYSLRILTQILHVIPVHGGTKREVQMLLACLPPLHVLMRSWSELRRELRCELSSKDTTNSFVNMIGSVHELIGAQHTEECC
ncbi:hypothetical protein VTN77DRAFT_5672 [Rasamsonia byssochlamydoides]|uniref:uncharacterized protein n=1 Tax=Rasamsonia byssochlamydoides TaxID=89139 RepID=UPI003742F844